MKRISTQLLTRGTHYQIGYSKPVHIRSCLPAELESLHYAQVKLPGLNRERRRPFLRPQMFANMESNRHLSWASGRSSDEFRFQKELGLYYFAAQIQQVRNITEAALNEYIQYLQAKIAGHRRARLIDLNYSDPILQVSCAACQSPHLAYLP